jgi:hypothetical protein
MAAEAPRIADQLRRAFDGEAWHGPSLGELLSGINAQQAVARPVPAAHSIWELVLHIDVWTEAASEAIRGIPMPRLVGTPKDWANATDTSAAAWARATEHLFQSAARLASEIDGFDDARLKEVVPGREYDFYYLFHGIVQHSLYHAGQIALLKVETGPAQAKA